MSRHKLWPIGIRGLFDYVLLLVGIGGIYLGIAKFSLELASIHPSATPIWPPTGYALAVVLLLGYRTWPAIFAGAFIANLTTVGSLFTSLAIASGNTLEALVAAYLVNRLSGGLSTFDTPGGVARFALICFVPSTVLSATLGVGSLALAGYAEWTSFRAVWITWWMGDLAGALVIAPVIVLWSTEFRAALRGPELARSAMVYAAAIAVGLVAFSPIMEQMPARTPLAFLAVLPLMWAALRRSQRDTATTALLLSAFAVWGTLSLAGPFVRGTLNESFLLLLAFMISVSVPSLALSADVAVRRRDDAHLKFLMRELSHRSKNLLAIVQSIASQIGRNTDSVADFLPEFGNRLRAIADTHDLLVQGDWRGASMTELVRVHLAPFHYSGESAIVTEGPELTLSPRAAEYIGLALHELATNALKHGALSVASGLVQLRWRLDAKPPDGDRFRLTWSEAGGPQVTRPSQSGFGDLVVTKVVPMSLNGTASLEFGSGGVRWELLAPTATVLA